MDWISPSTRLPNQTNCMTSHQVTHAVTPPAQLTTKLYTPAVTHPDIVGVKSIHSSSHLSIHLAKSPNQMDCIGQPVTSPGHLTCQSPLTQKVTAAGHPASGHSTRPPNQSIYIDLKVTQLGHLTSQSKLTQCPLNQVTQLGSLH